jgi:hypothetical protein
MCVLKKAHFVSEITKKNHLPHFCIALFGGSLSPSFVEGSAGGRRTPATRNVAEGRDQASASTGGIGMGAAGGGLADGEARHLKSSLNTLYWLCIVNVLGH